MKKYETRHTFIAVTVEENNTYYAYVVPVSNSDNLLSKLKIKGIIYANICRTKKEAQEVVAMWNDCYKANNTYMFADPQF